jgi:hypothetical protein
MTMHRYLLAALLLLSAAISGCYREVADSEKTEVYTVAHTHTKAEAYNIAEVWIAEHYVSAKAVIDVRQPDAGLLLGKGVVQVQNDPLGLADSMPQDISFKIQNANQVTTITFTAGRLLDQALPQVLKGYASDASSLGQALGGTTRKTKAAMAQPDQAKPAPATAP